MEQTKERVVFYEEPIIMDKIDDMIKNIEDIHSCKLTRSAFIRIAIREYLKLHDNK